MREPFGPVALGLLSLVKRVLLLHRSLLLHHVVLGPGEDCERREATYLGEGETLPYLVELHGGHGPRRRVPLLGVRRALRRRGGGLLYLELNRLLPRPSPGCFRSFPWLRQRVDLDDESFRSRRAEVEGVFGRKVRHFGLTYRLALDAEAVDTFYDEFYVPYVAARHAGALHLRRRRELHHAVRHGFLLEVVDAAEWVAGAVCRRHRDGLTILAYGLRGDEAVGRQRGWLSAATYFAIDLARREGLSWVDLLRSRPHVDDGVFEHKRRFGAVAARDPWPHTAIWILPPTDTPLPTPAQGLLVAAGTGLTPLSSVAGERAGV